MKKVWAIAEGEYSSWSVVAVFEREDEAAQAVAEGMADEVVELAYFPAGQPPKIFTEFEARGVEGTMDIVVKKRVYHEMLRHSGPPQRPKVDRFQPFELPIGGMNTLNRQDKWCVRAVSGDRDAAVKAVKDRLAAVK